MKKTNFFIINCWTSTTMVYSKWFQRCVCRIQRQTLEFYVCTKHEPIPWL